MLQIHTYHRYLPLLRVRHLQYYATASAYPIPAAILGLPARTLDRVALTSALRLAKVLLSATGKRGASDASLAVSQEEKTQQHSSTQANTGKGFA